MSLTIDEMRPSITFPILKQLAKDLNIFPHQLFVLEDIKTDKEFGQILIENENLKTKQIAAETEKLTLTQKINDYSRKEQMQTAKSRLTGIIADRKLTEKPKVFIEKSFEKEVDKLQDITDEALKTFVNQKFELFQEVNSITGEKPDINIPVGDGVAGEADDMSNPKNNPLLKA